MTVTFQAIKPGDTLPIVIKWETAASIQRANARVSAEVTEEPDPDAPLHPSVVESYVKELLQKAFPPQSLSAPETSVKLELTTPVEAGDTISLSGKVFSKRKQESGGLVECEIVIENHRQETVGRAAVVVLLSGATDGGQLNDAP